MTYLMHIQFYIRWPSFSSLLSLQYFIHEVFALNSFHNLCRYRSGRNCTPFLPHTQEKVDQRRDISHVLDDHVGASSVLRLLSAEKAFRMRFLLFRRNMRCSHISDDETNFCISSRSNTRCAVLYRHTVCGLIVLSSSALKIDIRCWFESRRHKVTLSAVDLVGGEVLLKPELLDAHRDSRLPTRRANAKWNLLCFQLFKHLFNAVAWGRQDAESSYRFLLLLS
mmetsp:Transcript_31866/g.44426  ORF Transcript_31866/g.44426 Transcript_31866/m.44426 type:complete len:224 (+) Transcript_31866:226-897(+)